MKINGSIKIFSYCILFLIVLVSACVVEPETVIQTNTINPFQSQEESFLNDVLTGIADVNESMSIIQIPKEMIDDNEEKQPHGVFAVVNNTETNLRIQVENIELVYIHNKVENKWERISPEVVNLTGSPYVELELFQGDWTKITLFEVDVDSLKINDNFSTIRLVSIGEKMVNGNPVPLAAWLDVPWQLSD